MSGDVPLQITVPLEDGLGLGLSWCLHLKNKTYFRREDIVAPCCI